MSRISLKAYRGKFLPHEISDLLFFDKVKGKKVLEQKLGVRIVKVEETPRNTWFYTAGGYKISSNGYVSSTTGKWI